MTRWIGFVVAAAALLTVATAEAQVIGAGQCCSCAAVVCTDFNLSLGQPCVSPCTIHNASICTDLVTPGAACVAETATPTLTPTATRTPTVTPTVTLTGTITLTPAATVTVTLTPTAAPTLTKFATTTGTITPTPKATKTTTKTPTATLTRRPTFTFTPTKTKTPTPTSTPTVLTPTPGFQPLVDQDQIDNATLLGIAYPTPGTCGKLVPCQSDVITATCTGAAATVQLQAIPHSGFWAGTPVAVGTPFTCPGWTTTAANFEQCQLCVTTPAPTPLTAKLMGWIDRRRKGQGGPNP